MNITKKLAGYQLRLSSQYWQRSFNTLLKKHGLTHAQYMVLAYLVWADKKKKLANRSQNQLAYNLKLDPMMVSNVLKALVLKGYVDKTIEQGSSASIIHVTRSGKSLIKELKPFITKFERKMFKKVGPEFIDDLSSLSKKNR